MPEIERITIKPNNDVETTSITKVVELINNNFDKFAGKGVQHEITKAWEALKLQGYLEHQSTTPEDKARQLSYKKANIVLTMRRNTRATKLSNDEIATAVQCRLGSTLVPKEKVCTCRASFNWKSDSHMLYCSNGKAIERHDMVCDALATIARRAGHQATREEPGQAGSDSRHRVDILTTTAGQSGQTATKLVEVAVVCATNKSAVFINGKATTLASSAVTEGYAAKKREADKENKYRKEFHVDNTNTNRQLRLGVVETSGRFGDRLNFYLKELAMCAHTGGIMEYNEFLMWAKVLVTAAVHKGNSLMYAVYLRKMGQSKHKQAMDRRIEIEKRHRRAQREENGSDHESNCSDGSNRE